MLLRRFALLLTGFIGLVGCTTSSDFSSDFDSATQPTFTAGTVNYSSVAPTIPQEPRGNYYIGRRYYRENFYYWGYLRAPGEPWKTAKLVMLNEHKKLAPDRAAGRVGSDHNYEYKITGYYSGDTVYEAASNSFFPEFVVTGFELTSQSPPPLFPDKPTLRGMRPRS